MFSQILDGVDHLHKKGWAHRDLKLQNFFLDSNCVLKIGDFGMLKFYAGAPLLTTKLGTEEYMAPEMLDPDCKEYLGPPVDIFALGVNLFIIHTARFPFQNCLQDWFYAKF
jgi:serine/threonine protein kinase